MDIDLRRLGIGAQVQIALTLIGKTGEGGAIHGEHRADCPVRRGTEEENQLRAADGHHKLRKTAKKSWKPIKRKIKESGEGAGQ